MKDKPLCVAFVGNPNCGKTTLFNAYTGSKLKVANWPGVTVEKIEGEFTFEDERFRLVDLPGTYSLTSYTMEETVTRRFLSDRTAGDTENDCADVIINVVDASSLERNLYLTLQLLELGRPVVVALNMMDIVKKRGMEIDMHRLPEMLGAPCVGVSARRGDGLSVLMHTVAHHRDKIGGRTEHTHARGAHRHDHHSEYTVVYSDEIEDMIDDVTELIIKKYPDTHNLRWHAIKLLEKDRDISSKLKIDISAITKKNLEEEFIRQKYDFIEEVINECVVNKNTRAETTDRADSILTHPALGIPVFFIIMAAVFFLTFTVGDMLKEAFVSALDYFSSALDVWLAAVHSPDWLISLVVDGVVAGVGGILTFLPNIAILFLALAFLEDSGYMARVAYIMDSVMARFGLSGRAFIPMILGFGCTVPAIMSSRTLENKRDKARAILLTPFMSCSAKLPVYVLFSEMFFGKWAAVAAFSMYLLGIAVAIVIAKIAAIADKKHDIVPLLIELPEYKKPSARTIFIYVWDKIKDYLSKAGTIIFISSVILWLILNFGPGGFTGNIGESFGAIIGRFISPVLIPCGLGMWQIALALIAGIAAKEVVVSSLSVLFAISNVNSAAGMAALSGELSSLGMTFVGAYALMAFVLLYIPCGASLAAIKGETGSWRKTALAAGMYLLTAWLVSAVIYQLGSLIFA